MNKYDSDEILHIKHKNGIEYLQFKRLNRYNIVHGIMLRHGGVSEGIYDSLNLRLQSKDNIQNIYNNISKVCEVLLIDENDVCKGCQTHTDNIVYIDQNNKKEFRYKINNKQEVDGYITDKKSIISMVTTADCIPVIMYDPVNNVIANIHSGWKGSLKKIYLKTLKIFLEKFDSNARDIIVCLGPSIGKCCFTSEEVEFKEKFTSIWKDENEYISYEKNSNRFHIDLKYLVIKDLIEAGVNPENIFNADICTKCNNNDFYSYRMTTVKKEEDYGTFATFVGLI